MLKSRQSKDLLKLIATRNEDRCGHIFKTALGQCFRNLAATGRARFSKEVSIQEVELAWKPAPEYRAEKYIPRGCHKRFPAAPNARRPKTLLQTPGHGLAVLTTSPTASQS